MYCKKCSGRVFVDRVFSSENRFDLFCIACGKRWFVKREGNALGRWLTKVEKKVNDDLSISI